ncbi:pentatricopeptide repeat-containing protein At1g06710, mitochondrial-like, partial [Fagus crenata]
MAARHDFNANEEENPILPQNSRVESVSAEDFAFLRDSSLDSNAESGSSAFKLDSSKCSNDVVLIVNAIQSNSDGFGDKTHKFLRQFRDKLNETLVVEVLNVVKNPELGVKFFIWAGQQIGYSHTQVVYDALLERLGCDSNEKISEQFLREVKDDDKEVLGKLLNVLIQKCCRNGLWNLALEELGRLKDFGYKPTRWTYNALVLVFLRADWLDTAYLVHREMSSSGFSMDEFTLGCFMHSLCKARRWREALSLIEKEEFVPETVLYTNMISGLCEALLFEEAMDFLNRMRSSSCIPKVGKTDEAHKLMLMMEEKGCYPNVVTYIAMIDDFGNVGKVEKCLELLREMGSKGCAPNFVTYRISENDFVPIVPVYRILIDSSMKVGKLESALELHEEIRSSFPLTATSKNMYISLIESLSRASKVDKAFELYIDMVRRGGVAKLSTFFLLIKGLININKWEE